MPRFYLQRFADKDDTIDVVRRDDTKISFRRTPESALFVREFYSLETDDGLDRYAERFFASDIETNGARAIRRLVNDGVFPPPDGVRHALSLFMAFQFVRGEAFRAALVQQYAATHKLAASLSTQEMVRRDCEVGLELCFELDDWTGR